MEHTSMGYHTFAFFQRLTEEESFLLGGHFMERVYAGEMKGFQTKDKKGWEYTYTDEARKGIRWLLRANEVSSNLTVHGVMAIVTPKVLTDNDYIAVAKAADLEKVEELYNREAALISPILGDFGSYSMSRGDPGLTVDLKGLDYPCLPEQLISLVKRGDIPKHFTERKEYSDNDKAHRKMADKYSHYLESGSVVINFYWKYPKVQKGHPEYQNREAFRNVIRFEVQCKYPKLYSISKSIRHRSRFNISSDEVSSDDVWDMVVNNRRNPSIPVDVIMSDMISTDVVRSYFNRVIRKGDYLTLDGARWMVEARNFRREKEERLIFALETINECRGIAKAKDRLSGDDLRDFKRSLKDLDAIMLNPVTIPRQWGIEHIPNPLRAYCDHVTEEQLLPYNERRFHDLLADYLSKC